METTNFVIKFIFAVLALVNIGIAVIKLFDESSDKGANISAIGGWLCAIIYFL